MGEPRTQQVGVHADTGILVALQWQSNSAHAEHPWAAYGRQEILPHFFSGKTLGLNASNQIVNF